MSESELLKKYVNELQVSHDNVYVDLGCSYISNIPKEMVDGSSLSLFIEPNSAKTNQHPYANQQNVTLLNKFATPDNIQQIIKDNVKSKEITILDIDIDSYDFEVLKSILEIKKPYILMAEVNEKIPYPIKFHVKYDHVWDGSHFFGMSFATFCNLVKEDYYVVNLKQNNVFAIRKDATNLQQDSYNDIYKQGYKEPRTKGNLSNFHYNSNVDHWLNLTPQDALQSIDKYFENYHGKYDIGI